MRKNNLELFTTKELMEINCGISTDFGERNRVTSGSYYKVRGNVTQCNITIGETNTYTSPTTVEKIGKRVKQIIGAEEVYSFGIKLA